MSSNAERRVNAIMNHFNTANDSNTTVQPQPTAAKKAVAVKKAPVKVVITGAAGQIAYSLIFMVAQGHMLGPDTPVDLRLLEIPVAANALKGVIMELQDCAYPLVHSVIGTTDYKTAFQDAEIALLVGAKPRGPGMQRRDLLMANAAIFKGQGQAINQYANRKIKVLVVGNPANTNALICQQSCPDLPASSFTAMTRLDQNRAKSQIAHRVGNVRVEDVHNVIIWGNHSKTQFPDINHAFISHHPNSNNGSSVPVRAAVNDNTWLDGEFLSTVQDRGAAIINVRQKSSAASAASSAVDHIRDWVLGTAPGEWVSMGVVSDGSYGVPKGIIFSFPCTCKNGQWSIVQGLKWDAFSKAKIDASTKELVEEKKEAGLN